MLSWSLMLSDYHIFLKANNWFLFVIWAHPLLIKLTLLLIKLTLICSTYLSII